MPPINVAAENVVAAPADSVYGYLADYRNHHQKFLPPAFSGYQVEEGGIGTGTVVRFILTAGGRSRQFRSIVSEPEPGRALTESDTGSSSVTTFTVTPEAGNASSRVRIETTWSGAGGIGGFFERRFAPGVMRRIYEEELVRLDTYARQQAQAGPGTAPST